MIILRRQVTLIELLLVIAILSLIVGFGAVKIRDAIVDQSFRTEVSRVVDELRLAQDLMLIFETDVHLKFAGDDEEGGIKYWLELETIQKEWDKEFRRKHKNLQTIHGVFMRDQIGDDVDEGIIDLKFLSKGCVMSRGLLRLASSDKDDPPPGTLQSYICLPGYPHPIFSTETPDGDKAYADSDNMQEPDERLTLDMIERLPEKVKNLSFNRIESENPPQEQSSGKDTSSMSTESQLKESHSKKNKSKPSLKE
jgi:hypothetical protein